jgi:predicted ester cyclase
MESVERYLDCLGRNDWDGLAATLSDGGVMRDGPFCDVVHGKDAYVSFLAGIVPALPGYTLEVDRISRAGENVAFVELSETFEVEGTTTEYPECLLFETAPDGLINKVSVFMKTPGGEAPVEGGRAS